MIKKISLGILCGIIATILVSPYDPWVQQQVGNALKNIFARAFHCTVSGQVQSFSIFNPHIVFKNFTLSSSAQHHGQWSWQATRYTTGFSWSHFLLHREIDMWITINGLTATSDMYEGTPSIAPHVKDILSVPDLPIKLFLKSTQIRNASATITDGESCGTFHWNSESKRMADKLRSHFYITGGSISQNKKEYARSFGGTIVLEAYENSKGIQSSMDIDGQIDLPQLGQYATCFIAGKWHNDKGRFNVRSIDKALRINPLIITQHNDQLQFNISITLPIAYCFNLFTQNPSPLQGTCMLHAQGTLDPEGYCDGYIACEDINHPWIKEPSILTCSFRKKRSKIHGSLDIRIGTHSSWHGTLWWKNKKGLGECQLYNNSLISIPYSSHWCIQPNNTTIALQYNKITNLTDAHYTALATNMITGATFESAGNICKDAHEKLYGHGVLDTNRYELTTTIKYPYIYNAALYDQKDQPLLHITYDEKEKVHNSSITMPLMRSIAAKVFQHEINGEGTANIRSRIDNDKIKATIHLADATIRLPQTYNFVNGFDASVQADITNKRITLRNIHCTLHSGSLRSPRAVIWIDSSGTLQFIHIPLFIDHCLFTVKQDLFAMISGYLLLTKQIQEDANLSGHIILDRSQLKENVFSEQEQKKLFQAANTLHDVPSVPLRCNLSIETKDPIRVDTNFLQANAEVDLHVHDYITEPHISGTVTVPSGTIKFPYKPLHITKGEITFFNDQLFNPILELVAKNKIKNHNVTLNIAGSIQNHAILLEATPPLTEEQIVNLLLTGAHEESLNAVIPALLMQNVSNFIFSSHKSNFFDSYIKPFMKQINVQLKPDFNDQTGRGGLRGALEITVSDRWRALIEKNFSLTEDTRFELEYVLSDDVTFRVIRDERRDVGGEVEMKWKF